jgi:sterol desaturase/sphingolipid hydroxylase (fatty acid hydroxylase superfamily)
LSSLVPGIIMRAREVTAPMSYDWQAALAFVATLVALTVVGRFLAFQVPALRRMRDLNREADRAKLGRKPFREAVKHNNRCGLIVNLAFYVTILPLCVSFAARPLWRHAADVVAVLILFDFFYYLTHRFLFHGRALRKVHSLHHQVHHPTHIDALYVHPLETAIGLGLFLASIPLVALLSGGPLNAFSTAVATLVFTQVNTINHAFVHLPYFPFKTLDGITSLHAAHHADMSRGNFATLTMLYDWMFGTLEPPVSRTAP